MLETFARQFQTKRGWTLYWLKFGLRECLKPLIPPARPGRILAEGRRGQGESGSILNLFTAFHQHTSLEILVVKNRSFLVCLFGIFNSVPASVTRNKSLNQTSLTRTSRNFLGHITKRPRRMFPIEMAGFRI